MSKHSRFKRLSHSIYECKYHVVFCPKYRHRVFKDEIKSYTERLLHRLAEQKEGMELLELNVQADHVHMVAVIPPKYAVSAVMGYLKGKAAIRLFQRYKELGKQYWGRHLWSRGYCVSTVGLDEEQIRKYVKWQEQKDKEAEQQGLFR
jgi:putative transposase